jgi:hypothetical protein
MTRRFIEVAIDERCRLAAHDLAHASAQPPCIALSFRHGADKRVLRAHQIAAAIRDALQLAASSI